MPDDERTAESRLDRARATITGKVVAAVAVTAAHGRADELIVLFEAWFDQQWQRDDHTELFVVGRSVEDPDAFYLVSAYSDVAALEAHLRHPLQDEFVPRFRELVVDMRAAFLDPIRAKGINPPRHVR